MPSKNKVAALAAALLTPKHIAITERIVQESFDIAINAKNKDRLRELSNLLTMIDSVKKGEEEGQ